MMIHDDSESEYVLDKSIYNDINNNDFMWWCHETAMIFTVTPLFLVPCWALLGPSKNRFPVTCWFCVESTEPCPYGFPFTKIGFIWVNYNELTTTSLEIIVSKGKYPQIALIQVSELYYNLPRFMGLPKNGG